jgi:hypothetical protein
VTHFVKNEPASRNTSCGCCAHQHRYGPADEIETTSAYREIGYDYNYKDLYNCARYTAEELTD